MTGPSRPRRPASAEAGSTRRAGRPRRPAVDDAILQATIELLRERGPDGTTMSAVVERSGLARATVYLRWPNRQALITAALRRAMGRPPISVSGDLEPDIRRAVEQAQRIFAEPAFRAIIPAIVASLAERTDDAERLSFDALVPGYAELAIEYRVLAERVGLRRDIRPELVPDIIVGAFMSRVLSSGQAPTPEDGRELVDVILEGVRVRASEPGG